jgi:hypothetical protein
MRKERVATYNLRRFAHADGLKAIAREQLLALVDPHKPYFDGRGLTLPPPSASDGIDYDQLVNVLMNPDTDTPKGLLDTLYFVHEMATPEAMDVLIQEAENNGISLDGGSVNGRCRATRSVGFGSSTKKKWTSG